jgi:hypothetical protein
MGPELGHVFHELCAELMWLHFKWQQYVGIFGTSKEQMDTVNEAAGSFFYVVQAALWEDTLLHLARLADPPLTMNKENLTLLQLQDLVPDVHRSTISSLTEIVRSKTLFARDWRKRHLAHRDLNLALKRNVKPLEPASRIMVREALGAMANLLNEVDRIYRDTTTLFEPIAPLNGATALLSILDEGLQAKKARFKQERDKYGIA